MAHMPRVQIESYIWDIAIQSYKTIWAEVQHIVNNELMRYPFYHFGTEEPGIIHYGLRIDLLNWTW